MSTPNPTPPTKWGWGRKTVPLNDVLGWAILPWKTIYVVSLSLPALTTFLLFGWNVYAWLLLFPILVVLIALPVLAFTILITSRLLHPDGPGKLDDYWIFHDKNLEQKYKGRKMPIEELYEAYFNGLIDLKNGDASLVQTLYARDTYARPIIQLSHVKFFLLQFIPELLAHTRQQDITQVRGHYDRGDDFYSAFLGEETMIYTSGIFQSPDDTLEESQYNKLNLIANKIHLKQGEQHLDIGCGWGTLISYYAKNYGSNSTGVTLGKNQHAWANAKAQRLGVSDRAQALCMDYRDIPEQTNYKKYDKITCLEMAEHVGVKYFESFLLQVKDMLKDDGLFYLQIAGLRRAWQFEDFCWGLFMGKYVFPGADASCPLGWVITQLEGAGYEIHSEETIGIHYSATIQRWYDNWHKNKAMIEEKYSKWWFRNWSWFLAWAVISPEQGSASCYQIVAHKNLCKFDRKMFIAERANWKI